MGPTRRQLLQSLETAGALTILDVADGWPGVARVTLPRTGRHLQVLVHIAPITTHARGLPGEVRLQPPGQHRPVQDDGVSTPILLAVSSERDVLVAAPAARHVGREERWTVTFREDLVRTARDLGWAATERPIQPFGQEEICAFLTPLLPVYAEMVASNAVVDPAMLQAAIVAAGLPSTVESPDAQERARVASSRLVREACFSRAVRVAYRERCAMCGLGLGLVAGAHIYPATAPGSQDRVWNGICLCENHHRAFDRHLIFIDPASLQITLHPLIVDAVKSRDRPAKAFVHSTSGRLVQPKESRDRVNRQMLRDRYKYFEGSYDWVERTSVL